MEINKGSNLTGSFGGWRRCSLVPEPLARLLARALPPTKIPASSCYLYLFPPPYVPRLDQRAEVARAIRSVFECSSRPAAQPRLKEIVTSYTKSAPKLATWMEENLPQGFTVFMLPAAHQKRMRTSNALERVNQELKRRTRVARVFPNEPSLPRLISALLAETSDDGETGKIYLNMDNQNPPSV